MMAQKKNMANAAVKKAVKKYEGSRADMKADKAAAKKMVSNAKKK